MPEAPEIPDTEVPEAPEMPEMPDTEVLGAEVPDTEVLGAEVPECLACGACCFSELEDYVRVTGDDYARLGVRAEELVWFKGNRAYLRMLDGHCAALEVDPRSGRLTCSAYEGRPQICRDLERGSAECLAERHTKSDRVLLSLKVARGPIRPPRLPRL